MIRALVAVLCAGSILTAGTAVADWTEKDVQKVMEKKKGADGFIAEGDVETQIVLLKGGGVSYLIDLRTQLCFFGARAGGGALGSMLAIPCAAVKKAFPVFAPLITWEQ